MARWAQLKRGNTLKRILLISLLGVSAHTVAQNRTDLAFEGNTVAPSPSRGVCPATIPVTDPLPFNDSGDSCNGSNSISSYSGATECDGLAGFSYGGEEIVYEIQLGATNNVGFSADLTGSTGDLALFLISTCNDGSTCVETSQDAIGVGAGPEVIDPVSYAAGTYYLYIDSYYDAGTAGSCGIYDLTVTGALPAELVEFAID